MPMAFDDSWDRARHEAEGQGCDPAEYLRLVAWEQESRRVLLRSRDFIMAAVRSNVRLPGFDPSSHHAVVAIDELLAMKGAGRG